MGELSTQECQQVLASEDRQMLFKGDLKLVDGRGKACADLYAFLFTDLLLLTEPRSKPSRKEVRGGGEGCLDKTASGGLVSPPRFW